MGAGVNKMIGDPCIFVRLIFVIKFICYFCIVFVKANRNRKSSVSRAKVPIRLLMRRPKRRR